MVIRTAAERILTHTVELDTGDGRLMGGYVARPATPGPRPGVVVGMELFGVSAHVRDVCARLARLGFTAIAPDLHHRIATWVELPEDATGRERGFELLRHLRRADVLADVAASIGHLRAGGDDRVGMVGLSLGGHIAYLAAAELDLAATVVCYGGWLPTTETPLGQPDPTLARTASITGRLLMMLGADDHVIPPAHRREIAEALRAAGVRHEIVEYPGVGHGFLNAYRDAFDPRAADDAWARTERLLRAELG